MFAPTARSDEPAQQRYWAYRPVVRPEIPDVSAKDLVRTPIDAFLLKRLEDRRISFSPPASKQALLRRAKFDLLGLPPTAEEVDEFLRDDSPQAFEKLLDRWLASPHYGERWGRMWLDVVRYADSAGFNADPLRPLAYKYRDYVIAAFNADLPYNRFVQEQLAGDELFPESESAATATGFLRLPPDESNASDVYLARQDLLNDLTGAVGSIFLGQSFGCAQCHDHKFDEITQSDFYRLQAFFAGVIPVDALPVGTAAEQVAYEQALEEWLKQTDDLRAELHRLEADARAAAVADKRGRFPESVWAAIGVPVERRNALEHQLAFYTERQLVLPEDQLDKKLSADQKKRRKELQQQLKEHIAQRPKPPKAVQIMGATDGTKTPATHLLAGGSYNKPERELQPGFPCAIEGA
ncbi:MAG TPA: DUF1549 domain-containing protein, partial [Planctomycetaceae bacterium]|nr:DUF1549 domain-containing protein [Planctomycetaceae bacterium]